MASKSCVNFKVARCCVGFVGDFPVKFVEIDATVCKESWGPVTMFNLFFLEHHQGKCMFFETFPRAFNLYNAINV